VAAASRSDAGTRCVDEHWIGEHWPPPDAIGPQPRTEPARPRRRAVDVRPTPMLVLTLVARRTVQAPTCPASTAPQAAV